MFCMFLRKHLLGARLSEVSQTPMERCAVFSFDCTDEMGVPCRKRLILELMGRNSATPCRRPSKMDCLRFMPFTCAQTTRFTRRPGTKISLRMGLPAASF